MAGWLSETRGTNGLMLETISAMCRENIGQACKAFEMEPATAKAVGALTPSRIPELLEALGPGQILGMRDSMKVDAALLATRYPESFGKASKVDPAWNSELGVRLAMWLQALRRACREAESEASVLYGMKAGQAALFGEMSPEGLHGLMQAVGPTELVRFRDSTGLASMLRGLRGNEERPVDVQLADRLAHSLRN